MGDCSLPVRAGNLLFSGKVYAIVRQTCIKVRGKIAAASQFEVVPYANG